MELMDSARIGLRVLIFDACPLFRDALQALLARMPELASVRSVDSLETLEQALAPGGTDLLCLDLDAGAVVNAFFERLQRDPGVPRVVYFVTDGSNPELMQGIRLQADGYLSKRLTAERIVAGMREVLSGRVAISDDLTYALAVSIRNAPFPGDARDIGALSPREVQVLGCIARGLSNRLIAEELQITDGTVKVHVKHLMKKLNFNSRVEAALWASTNVKA